MDPLSHVLALSNVESAICAELRAGGEWAIAFPGQLHVKFGFVLSGSCWLEVEGVAGALRLHDGDCYLIVGGRPYRLSSDPAVAPVPAHTVWSPGEELGYCGTGHDATLVGGRFTFDRPNADLLLDSLAPVTHLAAASDESGVLRAALHLVAHETGSARPGQTLMLDHLAHIILMQGLRTRGQQTPFDPVSPGWPGFLVDPPIEAVLRTMHDDVARSWPIAELAEVAGMSRSTFSDRFRSAVGQSPAKYLLSLRMHTAKQLLLKSDKAVSAVAAELGYGSEGAFSTAFKRVMGASPRAYRFQVTARDQVPEAPEPPVTEES